MFKLCILFQVSVDPSLITDAEVYWTLNGRGTVSEWTRVRRMAGDPTMFSIEHTIPTVTTGEVGQYACHVITSFDSAHSTYARLTVRSGTRILEHPQSIMVLEGGQAEFT